MNKVMGYINNDNTEWLIYNQIINIIYYSWTEYIKSHWVTSLTPVFGITESLTNYLGIS